MTLLAGDFFTDGSYLRQPNGSEVAGWDLPPFLPKMLFEFCSAPSRATLGLWRIVSYRGSLVLLKASDGLSPALPVANVFAFSLTRNVPLGSLWVSLMLEGTLPWPTSVITFFYCPMASFIGHAGNAGDGCAGCVASLGS